LFAAGSLIAALADNFTVILAGRAVQGVGGGGLLALTEVRRSLAPDTEWLGDGADT